MKYKDEHKRSLEVWGEEAQIIKASEEMGELLQVLNKYLRLHKNQSLLSNGKFEEKKLEYTEMIQEEVADVQNAIDQMKLIFGHKRISKLRELKVQRAMRKIDQVIKKDSPEETLPESIEKQ